MDRQGQAGATHRIAMRAVALAVVLSLSMPAGAGRVAAQTLPVEVSLVLDRSAYEPGMPIAFTVRIHNPNAVPVTLLSSAAQPFDLVLRAELVEVGRLSQGRVAVPTLNQQRLLSGEVLTYSGQWTPATTLLPALAGLGAAQPLPPGLYSIHAELSTAPRNCLTHRAILTSRVVRMAGRVGEEVEDAQSPQSPGGGTVHRGARHPRALDPAPLPGGRSRPARPDRAARRRWAGRSPHRQAGGCRPHCRAHLA